MSSFALSINPSTSANTGKKNNKNTEKKHHFNSYFPLYCYCPVFLPDCSPGFRCFYPAAWFQVLFLHCCFSQPARFAGCLFRLPPEVSRFLRLFVLLI